ncbi:MAG: uncharacterized protein A8A55_1821 [Amphiamblys sp. WSBS2006]|nr:MAG: uncharacterized protein A8A55_1821 [Amphiamblys sp. WSBS2006]
MKKDISSAVSVLKPVCESQDKKYIRALRRRLHALVARRKGFPEGTFRVLETKELWRLFCVAEKESESWLGEKLDQWTYRLFRGECMAMSSQLGSIGGNVLRTIDEGLEHKHDFSITEKPRQSVREERREKTYEKLVGLSAPQPCEYWDSERVEELVNYLK